MDRVFFRIGPMTVYTYGLFVALGFILAYFFTVRDSKKAGLDPESIAGCMLTVFVAGLIGGRMLFVLINWQYFFRNPLHIMNLSEGGLAFQGALLAAIIAGAVFLKIKKIQFLPAGDIAAPYLALGQAVGRIGCFFNGCCYGKISPGGGIFFPGEDVPRLPVQIYSSAFLLLLFTGLIFIGKKRHFPGKIFVLYLILSSAGRFFMDFLRDDNPVVLWGMMLSQVISIAIFVVSALLFFALKVRSRASDVL